jgi:hypothetical protein
MDNLRQLGQPARNLRLQAEALLTLPQFMPNGDVSLGVNSYVIGNSSWILVKGACR